MPLETRISPMEEINEQGEKVLDLTPQQATVASARLKTDENVGEAEAARLLLEKAANEKTSQEDRQRQIDEILKNLK